MILDVGWLGCGFFFFFWGDLMLVGPAKGLGWF